MPAPTRMLLPDASPLMSAAQSPAVAALLNLSKRSEEVMLEALGAAMADMVNVVVDAEAAAGGAGAAARTTPSFMMAASVPVRMIL